MKKYIAFFLIFSSLFLGADEQIKQIIAEKHQALQSASTEQERSQIFYELALAYYQDQEIDRAFSHFLEALKREPESVFYSYDMSQEEALHFTQACADYLAYAGGDPVHAAEELLQKYGEIANQNPHFLHLNFLIAAAYANLGKYDDFFCRFYRGFPFLHDTFLAYKTQGILYLRLSHHGKSNEERKRFQEEAFHYLTLALTRNPEDSSLYKVLIFLAKEEKNQALILSYLQKIVQNKVILPRCDIYLYVRESVSLGEFELGQEMIDQARSHYNYSRAISAAQEYLNQQARRG